MAEEDEAQQQNPQSPKTPTLETPPDPQNPHNPDQQNDHNDPQEEDQIQDDPEEIPSFSPPIPDPHGAAASASAVTTTTATVSRRAPKRTKLAQKRRAADEKKSQKKLEALMENLKPIPFVPTKTLDFEGQEALLKRLGLWDFVHLDFDRNIRVDLIAQLIASFCQQKRRSYVNGARIMVNRADLARSLKLPVRKEKSSVSDGAGEVPESEESIAFVENLVSNWVLLHEDTWMMPDEVLKWTKVIKEGHFEKVDWASLFWFMVEKELLRAPKLVNCYYASHLQCLIKVQHEELLTEETEVVEVEVKEDEEVDDSGDVKMDLEEDKIELSLGQENVEQEHVEKENVEKENVKENVEKELVAVVEKELVAVGEKDQTGDEDVMDFEENKEEEPELEPETEPAGQWLLDGKNNGGEHFLRPCNIGEVKGLDFEGERKQDEGEEEEELEEEEEEEEEHDEGFHISPKCNALEGLSSANLIQAMEEQIPISSEVHLRSNLSSGEFHSSRVDRNTVPGCNTLFGNANKREIEHDDDIGNHSLNVGGNKRLRSNGMWDQSSDFDTCMDQVQHWMGKARMVYEAKEQAYTETNMNQQVLINQLQQRDNMIDHLHKAKFEEQQKRQTEVYRLEREIYVMQNLLEGYRKALKETHRAFAEYRARFRQADEPLYKDVPGSGGLVLSIMELEKLRLKKEQEDRITRTVIEKKVEDFQAEWVGKFEAHQDGVNFLGNRLQEVENEVKLVKELSAGRRVSETPECAPME